MPNLKVDATKVYLFIEFSASAFFSMMFVTMSLYEATVAGLDALAACAGRYHVGGLGIFV